MKDDPKTSSDEHDAGTETYEGGPGDDGDGGDASDSGGDSGDSGGSEDE